MDDQKTGYLNFKVYDVFNFASLSAYSLPSTPLTFIPQFDTYNSNFYSNQYILWEFGDGSYSKSLTSTHAYQYPGEYNVTLKLIDKSGDGIIDTVNRTVQIYDFVPDNLAVYNSGFSVLTAGNYSPPFTVYRYNSWQTYNLTSGQYSIIPYASGGVSIPYDTFNYSKQPYSHLIPTKRFVVREQIGVLNIYDDIVVDKIITSNDKIYVELDHDNKTYIVRTYETTNSTFAGTSGQKEVYFIDDLPTSCTGSYNLVFTLDTTNFDHSIIKPNLPIYNVNSVVYTFNYVATSVPIEFSITSNGIAGEGQDLPTFDINSAQFQEGVVSFVARPRTANNYSVNYIPLSSSTYPYNIFFINAIPNTVHIGLLNKNNEIIPGYVSPLSTIQISKSEYNDVISPYIKGKIYLSNVPAASCEDVKIFAIGSLTNLPPSYTDETGEVFYNLAVSGVSTPFTIYNKSNYGKVAKVNENFDSLKAYQSLATQPTISESSILIDNVLGQIGGDINANFNTLGKRIYERIANYVPNLSDVDTCTVESLFSQCEFYGVDTIKYVKEDLITRYPAEITRLVDLFSIKRNYLFGTRNNWNENLDKRTNVFSQEYGINTNLQTPNYSSQVEPLDIATTILNKSEKYIVAYENFTKLYSLQPLYIKTVTSNTYPLSSIDISWGWNLVLPTDFYSQSQDLKVILLNKFYTFYKWNDYIDGTILENTINWDDTTNTQIKLPYYEQYPSWNNPSLLSSWDNSTLSAWYLDNGYVDRNIIFTLSNGVGILSGAD